MTPTQVATQETAGIGDVVIALIDAALSRWADRKVFSHDEAAALLRDVQLGVHDTGLEAAVTSIVNDALASYQGDQLVDRWRVLDPLLDLRLALQVHTVALDGARRAAG